MHYELTKDERLRKTQNEDNYLNYLSNVQYNDFQKKHFIPNEIFDDMLNSDIKPVHLAFSYSYYYLISWLYRYGKYGELAINNGVIKQLLGYNPNNKRINYIIKEKGVLDSIGYTHSTKDYSVGVREFYDDGAPEFLLMSDLNPSERGEAFKRINRSFKAKYPIKHLHRYNDDFKEGMYTGVFYDPSNTHQVNFDIFSFCMSNSEIGVTGFLIYGFLKSKCQIHQGAYQVSYTRLSEQLNIPYSTLAKYLDVLRGYRLITGVQNQEYYVEGLKEGERESNYYTVEDSVEKLFFIKKDYNKVKGISLKKFKEMKKERGI